MLTVTDAAAAVALTLGVRDSEGRESSSERECSAEQKVKQVNNGRWFIRCRVAYVSLAVHVRRDTRRTHMESEGRERDESLSCAVHALALAYKHERRTSERKDRRRDGDCDRRRRRRWRRK